MKMNSQWSMVLSVLALSVMPVTGAEFDLPVMMKAGEQAVRVESPGYASPCWTDFDGDGKKDLLVGQFRDGKIMVYRNLGEGKLAEGQWLEADGQVATVPGVW